MIQEKVNIELLGILLHFGHLFSGFKDKEIADYGKGFVMGITIALELAGKIDSNILPEGSVNEKKGTFAISQFFRGYYYSLLVDRTGIQDAIDAMNTLDFTGAMKEAREYIVKLIGSKQPFFVDPANKNKQ